VAGLHVWVDVLPPFPFLSNVTVTVLSLLLCAYAVLPLLVGFNVMLHPFVHTHALCAFADVLNQIGVNPLGGVIVGHVVLQL
jgi:hypothetical protein